MNGPDSREELVAPDAWLARTLAVPTFALRPPFPAAPTGLVLQMEKAAASGDAFFFAKLPGTDAAAAAALEAAGFRQVDTQVTLERGAEPAATAPRVKVRPAEPRDRDAVLDIAGTSFRFSRFHQDPRIGLTAAHAVKRAWAANCLDGRRGEEVLVALDQDRPAGFLAVLLAQGAAIIDLIAVAAQNQRRGIGGALVDAFIGRWRNRATRLRVGTQQANTASLRLYEGRGFRAAGTTRVLHAHWRAGRVR